MYYRITLNIRNGACTNDPTDISGSPEVSIRLQYYYNDSAINKVDNVVYFQNISEY